VELHPRRAARRRRLVCTGVVLGAAEHVTGVISVVVT
jgi:hypothetical protein